MAKFTRSVGPDKHYQQPGRTIQYRGLYVGYVKNNVDVQKMGRLQVWIPEFGSQEEDKTGWFTVTNSSPFAGATSPKFLGNNIQLSEQTQTSYGFWAVPPDLDNQVLIMFANGDPTRGIIIGYLFQQFMNQMIPGMPADKNYQFTFTDAPTAEYNKNTSENIRDDITRPAAVSIASGIIAQGLIHDNVRGVTTTGARRESPSEVYGLLTPGPKNPDVPGHRLGGSQFYMDDGDGSEHIRIRTRTGAQFLVDETNGLVYAINKTGTSWMQMDADGNFDIFAAKSVSIRSQEDINYRADRDINIEAGRNINIKARNDFIDSDDGSIGGEDAGTSGGNIVVQALNNVQATVKNNIGLTVTDGNIDLSVAGSRVTTIGGSDNLNVSGAMVTQSGSTYDLNAGGAITVSTGGTLGIGSSNFDLSGGNLGVTGNVVAGGKIFGTDFKTGSISLSGLQGHVHKGVSTGGGVTLPFTGSGGVSSVSGPTANIADTASISTLTTTTSKTNILSTFIPPNNDIRDEEKVLTIVGRFLTFEPCPEHLNQGGQ